ncbi:hypothetical protein BJ875DRAFT_17448 [Amylocarpus encephaloides]|uniref:Protein HRI1 n=1 Tax=Amylocarpus encephaloides TaxID=45428 RepID=A0A9P7YIP4_9HELO|nr:hypothetical protein BJ875DRAFT_17448 [Amylocarpus encephaloides]
MPPQVLKRISVRWFPDPAYEDTDTIALNVGGYFLDLRVENSDASLQWCRAGERKVVNEKPFSYQWTRIIDSSGVLDPDKATWDWEELGNGDALEAGIAHCPSRDGALTPYEEVWRDVTHPGPTSYSWILQSVDGTTFLGSVGGTFLGMKSYQDGGFAVRRNEWDPDKRAWDTRFDGGKVAAIPKVDDVAESILTAMENRRVDTSITIADVEYVVRSFEKTSDSPS